MNLTPHPTNNAELGPPKDWDHSKLPCVALPVTRVQYAGYEHVLSFWKPTPEELLMLCAGGTVGLWIAGTTMPPVMLTANPAVPAQPEAWVPLTEAELVALSCQAMGAPFTDITDPNDACNQLVRALELNIMRGTRPVDPAHMSDDDAEAWHKSVQALAEQQADVARAGRENLQ